MGKGKRGGVKHVTDRGRTVMASDRAAAERLAAEYDMGLIVGAEVAAAKPPKSKRGRPKKDRARFPSGQVKPETAGITATALQRLRSLGTLPMLETQVGRLVFLGELTSVQADTAHLIAEIYGRYDRAMGRRRNAASLAYEVGRGRDAGLHESDDQAERAKAAIRRYGELQAEIRLCPRGVKASIEELCVEDRPCPPTWLPAVKIALDMLAVSLRLTRRRAFP